MSEGSREASEHTRASNAAAAAGLPVEDREDFQESARGLVRAEPSLTLLNAEGRPVWDMEAYAFLREGTLERPPESVNPSLWRMALLNCAHGLFEVVTGVYQVRGYDISNMTLIEGERGVIVVDPLVSKECAAAALELYRRERGERPVSAVLYTHSHVDHFGGVRGVVSQEQVDAGEIPVWAPEHFLEHAVSENVLAGTAMARRAEYMFAARLARGPEGQVDAGIGKTTSTGTVTLIAPTHEVTATSQRERIDGVEFVFQLVPDSEAPAEMNFHLPELRALCVAENATHSLHNVLTPRGALVRDALAWSKYLAETVSLFGEGSDVMFAQHHWPRWGRERLIDYLNRHRDLYRYLHDQTLRLANRGLTASEIAAEVQLPPALAGTWACRGYYGTVSFNVRAVYQRYLGFFDGNPAHLDELPPEVAGRRYVELAGGLEPLLDGAERALTQGDYRWSALLASHAVFAEPDSRRARELEASALEQLGYQSESAVWRNIYLVGAKELRDGRPPARGARVASADVARALSIEQLWDAMGARVDGPRAWGAEIVVAWEFTDVGESWTVTLANGALTAARGVQAGVAQASVTLTRAAFDAIVLKEGDPGALFASGEITLAGDGAKLGELLGLLDEGDSAFAVVTP
jgi:alkyl sulfatase BDS1-like metallo-beta-lactamase superfamily hydrolase